MSIFNFKPEKSLVGKILMNFQWDMDFYDTFSGGFQLFFIQIINPNKVGPPCMVKKDKVIIVLIINVFHVNETFCMQTS